MTDERGAIWRKWDLQVHTPYSTLNNGFGPDFRAYAKRLLEKAGRDEIAAVGVTDYFTLQGYAALRKLMADRPALEELVGVDVAQKALRILFIPNIELRTSVIVRDAKGADSRVNFHVLFSDELSVEDIEEHFLRELKFTAEANPDSKDERWALTLRNLAELGRRLKEQHAKFQQYEDLYVGMMNAVIDDGQVSQILEAKPSIFRDRYLFCLPCDEDLSKCSWDGQGHLARKLLIQKSHLLFSANEATREFGLGRKHATSEHFRAEFKSLKPCIHSSDAHNFDQLFSPDKGRYTWIKADCTFRGLLQVLEEPSARSFIGVKPSKLAEVERNPTKYISTIRLQEIPGTRSPEKWFGNRTLELSHELVAVIGRKGSGKSALSDVIGLLGNSTRLSDASFLNSRKFRHSKLGKAKYFQASATLVSGDELAAKRLDEEADPSQEERVKYIPQNYLEKICNEFMEDSPFSSELRAVIFSHISTADRLGCTSLDELIRAETDPLAAKQAMYRKRLRELNGTIAALEGRVSAAYVRAATEAVRTKRQEFEAHVRSKPPEVAKPDPADRQSIALTSEVTALRERMTLLGGQVQDAERKLETSKLMAASIRRVDKRLSNLESMFHSAIDEMATDFATLGLTADKIVSLTINRSPLQALEDRMKTEIQTLEDALKADGADSLRSKLKAETDSLAELQGKLEGHDRDYQTYLTMLDEWEKKGREVVGGPGIAGSLQYEEARVGEIQNIPGQLEKLRRVQIALALRIYRATQETASVYRSLYRAVQDVVRSNVLVRDRFGLNFEVGIAQEGLEAAFFALVSQGKKGTFYGGDAGRARLTKMLDAADFESRGGIRRFLEGLMQGLRSDQRENGEARAVGEQLKDANQSNILYDLMYGLTYLKPRYKLTLQGKDLEQLSPGERGTLLLMFYLLVDRNNIPLIIDQPEENLDNQTVHELLVPCIREAKTRRQIVIVTHNPNLAVVCDAEQVIHAHLDPADGNRVTYTSGAIENETINRLLIDVLEGTRPAFDNRDAKYFA